MHLYAAYLGGPLDGGWMGEGHEVVFVVAADRAEAKTKAEAKWRAPLPATSTRWCASTGSTVTGST
jgi:hypothetical protein